MKYFDILCKTGLFSGINEPDLERLLKCLGARTEAYEKGGIVMLNGIKPDRIGIVLSGQVRVVYEDYYGNRSIITQVDAGGIFGESFALAGIKALPVSVLASEAGEVMLIESLGIASPCPVACEFHSILIRNMFAITAMKNLTLMRKIEFISKRTTRDKLLAYLSAEATRNGSRKFHIPFDRQGLADYLAVERSAMSAELSRLKKDGILDYSKNYFELNYK